MILYVYKVIEEKFSVQSFERTKQRIQSIALWSTEDGNQHQELKKSIIS